MGNVITVTGETPADELGVTLPHEHLVVDLTRKIEVPKDVSAVERRFLEAEPSPENLWWMRDHPHETLGNNVLDDVPLAVEEAMRFKAQGGNTIVDVGGFFMGRDPVALREISRRTGVNVVMGTGYYVPNTYPDDMDDKSAEDIAEEIVADVREGYEKTGIRAGVIGEIGTTPGFRNNELERRSIRAAAMAQGRTGAPITVHSTIFTQEGHDILDTLENAGADLGNVILGHMDATIRDDDGLEYHRSLAERNAYVEFDLFGHEWYFPSADRVLPPDEDKIRHVMALFNECPNRILLSQDVCMKINLTAYGGFGYDHLLRNIAPRFRRKGFDEGDLRTLLVSNPRSALRLAT